MCCAIHTNLLILLLYQLLFLQRFDSYTFQLLQVHFSVLSNFVGISQRTLYSIDEDSLFSFCVPCIGNISYQLILANVIHIRVAVRFFHWIKTYRISFVPTPVFELTSLREPNMLLMFYTTMPSISRDYANSNSKSYMYLFISLVYGFIV